MRLMKPEWVDSVDSTNKELKRKIEAGVVYGSGYVFAAVEQYAGKGRFDRSWKTVKGQNLTFSLIVDTTQSFPKIATVPMASGLGVCRYLRDLGVNAKGKWPNDVLVGDNKICGILSEIATFSKKEYIVVGIGINLNMEEDELSAIDKPATSLFMEIGRKLPPNEVLSSLLPYISKSLTLWEAEGFAGIRRAWEDVSWRINEEVVLENVGKNIAGKLVGYGADGQLLLELADGTQREFWSGDVSIRRT